MSLAAHREIVGCEHSTEDAEIPLPWVLNVVTGTAPLRRPFQSLMRSVGVRWSVAQARYEGMDIRVDLARLGQNELVSNVVERHELGVRNTR